MTSLQSRLATQEFANEYELVDGVAMHQSHGNQFRVPHDVLKRHVGAGHFVELRVDSPRFSIHENAAEKCMCPSCDGETNKPILRHEHPATLLPLPPQQVPARGWGEDFWVQITEREEDVFLAVVDNPLVETRLHEINQGDEILFHSDHLLAVHSIHREELVLSMNASELKELAQWIALQNNEQ